jgi:hypothetical protein
MREERLYQILQPETREPAARLFRCAHHAMVAAGIGIMLADTVAAWRHLHRNTLDAGFQVVSTRASRPGSDTDCSATPPW